MPNTTKTKKPKPKKESELKAIQFSDIEDIQMLVTVKGKTHILVAKPDQENDAEIAMDIALKLALDHHQIMDPSIDEIKDFKILLKEITEE